MGPRVAERVPSVLQAAAVRVVWYVGDHLSLSLSLSVHLSLYDNDRANDKLAEVNPDPSVAEACKVLWLPTYSALSVLTETQWKRSTDIQTTSSSIQGFW